MTPSLSPIALVQTSPGFAGASNVTAAPGGAGSRSEQSAVGPPSGEPASGIVIATLPDGDPPPQATETEQNKLAHHHPAQRMPAPSVAGRVRIAGWLS